jgi:serine/threonine protein kinase
MNGQAERRRWPREVLPTPEVGLVYPHYDTPEPGSPKGNGHDTLLVYLLNMSAGGFLLESLEKLEVDTYLDLRIRLPQEKIWQAFTGKVVWARENPTKSGYYLMGVEFQQLASLKKGQEARRTEKKRRMAPCELEFLMNTPLLDAIPLEAKCPLLNCMTPGYFPAGERLMPQGDEGDSFYIIEEGSCVVRVEKDGRTYPIARVRPGEIVGEMAILTGERRNAHVDAERDVRLWSLTRAQFDALCASHPDLRDFLTELVTQRFSTAKLTADRTIGKYLLNEVIGRGGWSVVYKGIHTSLNMHVAIKMLKHDMAMNPDFSQKFQNEAKTIARLNHENIVKVYDIEELYRTIFIVMEYLEGVTLEYILDKMPGMDLSKILSVILQVCDGLGYAHAQGIIHQDVKPGNIFIQPGDRVKIVDFGLACPSGTVDFCFPGTVFYMSPEQIEGDPLDERTDIYSLGITAYEMITGRRPYPENDLVKLMHMHVNEDVPDPRTIIPDLPEELYRFLAGSTERAASARYKSVGEIVRELQPLADRLGVKREPHLDEQRKMMSLFLFYQDEHQLMLNRLVEDFSNELKKIGAVLRAADFKDV